MKHAGELMPYVTVGGVVVSVLGAIIVALPDARLSDDEIREIAASKWDSNPDVEKAFRRARRTARYGIALIAVGTAIQLLGLALPY